MNDPEIRMIPLTEIVQEVEWYPRRRLDPDRVADYAGFYQVGGPSVLPALLVGEIPGVAGFWLVNGWHRTAAAFQARLPELPAVVRPFPDRWAAFMTAVWTANRGELSLRPGEKGRAVDRFIQAFPQMVDRELAVQLGVSHVYVWKRRQKLLHPADPPDPRRAGSRELLGGLRRLFAGRRPEAGAAAQEAAAEALAATAARQLGTAAGPWLQQLEATAHGAWLRVAAGDTSAPSPPNHPVVN